ncbi:N-acetylmuramoyl-L-alanine amidase, partial [Micromonospora sp. CPCC 205371]|nr:N-acetylmuramoyl-L-alanine amidase [Micromonospora sp. CPCC 205371]
LGARAARGAAAPARVEVAPAGPPPPTSPTVPRTMSAARGAVPAGVAVSPMLPLTHLSVAGAESVRIRTADGWQPWQPVTDCPCGPDGTAVRRRTLIPASGALSYEVRGNAVLVTEVNTVDGPARATAAPEAPLPFRAPAQFRPRYLSRAAWGADESYRLNPDGTLDTPPAFYPVQTLTVHHSGEASPAPDPISHIRGIYYNQAVVNDWGDIGYQLIIDEHGRVYEGTYSDPDSIPVFGPALSTNGLPMMVNGSHVGGFNAGNIGICVLGNYMLGPPSAASMRSLTHVLALLAAATRLNPLGTTRYVNPVSGASATIATIAGHQDWHTANPAAGATLCPGDHLYALLPRIRADVDALVRRLPVNARG